MLNKYCGMVLADAAIAIKISIALYLMSSN